MEHVVDHPCKACQLAELLVRPLRVARILFQHGRDRVLVVVINLLLEGIEFGASAIVVLGALLKLLFKLASTDIVEVTARFAVRQG